MIWAPSGLANSWGELLAMTRSKGPYPKHEAAEVVQWPVKANHFRRLSDVLSSSIRERILEHALVLEFALAAQVPIRLVEHSDAKVLEYVASSSRPGLHYRVRSGDFEAALLDLL